MDAVYCDDHSECSFSEQCYDAAVCNLSTHLTVARLIVRTIFWKMRRAKSSPNYFRNIRGGEILADFVLEDQVYLDLFDFHVFEELNKKPVTCGGSSYLDCKSSLRA